MALIKAVDKNTTYFVDNENRWQGERTYRSMDTITRSLYADDQLHGEALSITAGQVTAHEYLVRGHCVHDFLLNPISGEEKMLLVLKYGAPLLDRQQ